MRRFSGVRRWLATLAVASLPLVPAHARELQSDRPTPWTVEPGRLQLETSVFQYTNDEGERTFAVGPQTLVKVGVQKLIDVELLFDGYNNQENGPRGAGDLGLRVKANLFGIDSADTALAVIVMTTFASGRREFHDQNAGPAGVLAFQTKVPAELELAVTAGYASRHPVEQDRTSEIISHVSLARSLARNLHGFIELASLKDVHASGRWDATLDVGVYEKFGENLQVDAGIYLGLTEAAEDLNPFLGLTFRL